MELAEAGASDCWIHPGILAEGRSVRLTRIAEFDAEPPPSVPESGHGFYADSGRSTAGITGGLGATIRCHGGKSPDRPKTYCTCVRPGGFQVPSPGGRIDGASVLGQYRRITR